MNVASRMESNSFPSCMHVSDAVVKGLRSQADNFVSLGERAIKGKGNMTTHLYKVLPFRTTPPPPPPSSLPHTHKVAWLRKTALKDNGCRAHRTEKQSLKARTWQLQVGDWEEAVAKFKTSQAEESLALANKEAAIENRAMSLAEGQHMPLALPAPAHRVLAHSSNSTFRCTSCS